MNMVDSNVVRCAASKGRSSSCALTSLLFRYNAVCLAGGLYFTLPFVPMRMNTSDDPTRGREVRSPGCNLNILDFDKEQIRALLAVPPLRRWASNWVRFVFGLTGFSLLDFSHPVVAFTALLGHHTHTHTSQCSYGSHLSSRQNGPFMDFDATLGFPGEGPPCFFSFPLLAGPALVICSLFVVVSSARAMDVSDL